jgi:hypothetical protein
MKYLYVYVSRKTGEKKVSTKPLTGKEWKLIRKVGQIINKL